MGVLITRGATVAAAAVLACAATEVSAQVSEREFLTVDRFVAHESTLPSNRGERVALFVREKLSRATGQRVSAGEPIAGRVVLFVHGGSVPSVPDYDLAFGDYSWMEFLAVRGFDTFAMDHQGYGLSARPEMDTPCNLSAADRAILDSGIVSESCVPGYSARLASGASDWDEIDTVVNYIRSLRGVERVSLVGWSMGGMRVGGYAARNPDKVDKLVLFAPFYIAGSPSDRPDGYPEPGQPMTLQTESALMHDRWSSNVDADCANQIEPGAQDAVWQSIMAFDSHGSIWASPRGVMRARTSSLWGWNAASAAQIEAPSLILVGREDSLLPAAGDLYRDMRASADKVLVRMECATHFAVWEASQYKFLHEASAEWLTDGTYRGRRSGEYRVAVGGVPVD